MQVLEKEYNKLGRTKLRQWRTDWNRFAAEALGVYLDADQTEILTAIQNSQRVSVASGTARGKDFIAAIAALAFLYLTPRWDSSGFELESNTKVILSAPTDRQITNIMTPEFTKLFLRAHHRGVDLPGRLVGNDIRTDHKEWFLTGFKADDKTIEAWSGMHADNIFFILTEATGIVDLIYDAIEGNMQGNSKLLLVFNPNISTGYAAASQRSPRFTKFRLSSLTAPNVVEKSVVIPGQVNYEWVKDAVEHWCIKIDESERDILNADFFWEGSWYRPSDLFRIKVLGLFPKVSEGVLIPREWIELANLRWKNRTGDIFQQRPLRLGVDVAGMGRDSSVFCFRFGDLVEKFISVTGGGTANHMEVAGRIKVYLEDYSNRYTGFFAQAFIDTIGEGAGVFSRLEEQKARMEIFRWAVHSAKFSQAAEDGTGNPLTDVTGQYKFLNMRAYLMWAVRDWLDPARNTKAMLPPDEELTQEMTETQWKFRSNGSIQIEDKEEIKKRIKRSTDKLDALADTFWPIPDIGPRGERSSEKIAKLFY